MDYFKEYMDYAGAGKSEPPAVFHRWTSLSIIGAYLGRQFYMQFGPSEIYPNMYVMLMGSPGTRKSTAIKSGQALLRKAGYTRFAADRTSKERFLIDMRQLDSDPASVLEDLEVLTLDEPAESYIVAGEFTDFIGNNNMEFATMLTNLWDNLPEYTQPKIQGKSVRVHKPTVNILGGNTPQGFSLAFPPEALGNGFLSRLILVHGETTGRKVAFPPVPAQSQIDALVAHLKEMKAKVRGAATITPEGRQIADRMYQEFVEIDDYRFKHYSTRRFTHLLKLAMIVAAARLRTKITEEDFLVANTILAAAEGKMPKALGEFGRSKQSENSNAVMEMLNSAKSALTLDQMFKGLHRDIGKVTELVDIIKSLQQAGKVRQITIGKRTGFVANHEAVKVWPADLLLEDFLTAEEMI